jgi:hypothetical protein
MKRRAFLQTSIATVGSTMVSTASAAEAERKPEQLYELRAYTLPTGKQTVLFDYLSKALLPALKRDGMGPTGVFTEKGSGESARVYVLMVSPSADQLVSLSARLAGGGAYQKAAADYLAARASDPVYTRIESSLLLPISGLPRLEKPDASKPRLFNLRIYESHNERAAQKKIEMFNQGELAIFKRVGLTPVFFAETLVGAAMPNLTYMLVFPDEAGREAAWTRFRDDAEWKKLRAIPEYADKEIVSRITNKILLPAPFSEI